MRPFGKMSEDALKAMTSGLKVGQARVYDNNPQAFMAVHVERISPRQYSVAHYFEQRGDLVPDPELVVLKATTGQFFPVSLQQATGKYTEAIQLGDDEEPEAYSPNQYGELVYFTNYWLKNIKRQQGGIKALRTTGVVSG